MNNLIAEAWNQIWKNNECENESLGKELKEIEKAYSSIGRYYHNLDHITNMLKLSTVYSYAIEDIKTLQLAVFYHDIVYSSKRKDNEEKSALYAAKRLKNLDYENSLIEKCQQFILATKLHNNTLDNKDLDFLLDFDLELLSAPWQIYFDYTTKIRKEYSFYPDLVYKPGRKKVLEHFLKMDNIYKTHEFQEKSEFRAKENLSKELEML